MNIEVSGGAIPRLTRRDISVFTRRVLLTLERLGRIEDEITDVSIAFVDDDAMKTLNRQFRHKNKTTDVLTFPADGTYGDPNRRGRPLGDIVVCVDQARRQASDENPSLATEVRVLILHGILPALGFDHEADDGEMNGLELEVRGAVGLG